MGKQEEGEIHGREIDGRQWQQKKDVSFLGGVLGKHFKKKNISFYLLTAFLGTIYNKKQDNTAAASSLLTTTTSASNTKNGPRDINNDVS